MHTCRKQLPFEAGEAKNLSSSFGRRLLPFSYSTKESYVSYQHTQCILRRGFEREFRSNGARRVDSLEPTGPATRVGLPSIQSYHLGAVFKIYPYD